jgi:transglutaminase-like putative cysteine protease
MKLKITHQTSYRYDQPVRGLVQSLRLTPSAHEGQRVGDWSIDVTGGERGAAFRDGAGDWIEAWTVRGPVEEVTVTIAGPDRDPRHRRRAARPSRDSQSAGLSARHRLTKPDDALRELAQGSRATMRWTWRISCPPPCPRPSPMCPA